MFAHGGREADGERHARRALLRADPAFAPGFYAESADVHLGLARHARAFSLMGFTPEWYRGLPDEDTRRIHEVMAEMLSG